MVMVTLLKYTCEIPVPAGTGMQYSAVSQNRTLYLYPQYLFWKHCRFTCTGAEPYYWSEKSTDGGHHASDHYMKGELNPISIKPALIIMSTFATTIPQSNQQVSVRHLVADLLLIQPGGFA
jgi:hypothetical protein